MWHDPLLKGGDAASMASSPTVDDAASTPTPKRAGRIIAGPRPMTVEPREQERQRLLGRVLTAEGRPSITRAVDEYLAGSFELPRTQPVWLQVLEHRDEARVAEAIATLRAILVEPVPGPRLGEGSASPERRAVLESRLRRIEELADEAATREAAAELRRFLQGKPVEGSV
ncbi:MAG: hypothetical protein FJ096_16355 [Deltaproteobacteria bacterium]|nr:hypothetical protein [Deltaproteobacteria bacterium]